jgi:hypothetical protein
LAHGAVLRPFQLSTATANSSHSDVVERIKSMGAGERKAPLHIISCDILSSQGLGIRI